MNSIVQYSVTGAEYAMYIFKMKNLGLYICVILFMQCVSV